MPQLLLLGAGASYGSESDKSLVPPLSANLFHELERFEPALWKIISKDVADQFVRDFEQGWLALAEKMPGAQTHAQRSMAGFFFRFGPTKDSLYRKLARRIEKAKWSGALATLNYERMLPLALHTSGVPTFCGPRPQSFTGIELCLPHGACHIFCDSAIGNAAAVTMDGRAVNTNGPVVAVDEPREFWLRIRTQAFPPVMSYFEPSKFTTSGANFIQEQRSRLQELIADADKIAMVGIAVRDQDAHIWSSLASATAPIYYCSGKSSKAAFEAWAAKNRSAKSVVDVISEKYWNDDFDSICNHLDL